MGIRSSEKPKSEGDVFVNKISTCKKGKEEYPNPEESSTSDNKSQLKEILGMMNNSLGEDLETLRVQLADQHFIDWEISKDAKIEFCSPSASNLENTLKNNKESIIGGDKGGSAIGRKSQNNNKSEWESVIMPRKLNLMIHTNINENLEILSSQNSSIISRIVEDTGDKSKNNFLEATGETWVILWDAQEGASINKYQTIQNDEDGLLYSKNKWEKSLSSNIQENVSEEHTMIIHKNVPSVDNMLNFGEDWKQAEELDEPEEETWKFKRRSKISVINEPYMNVDEFRRVESTSSFKRLPKINEYDG